jgi:hypothetical protein
MLYPIIKGVIPTEAKPGPQQTPTLRLLGWQAEWRDLAFAAREKQHKIPRLATHTRRSLGMTFIFTPFWSGYTTEKLL